jgi:hypothetical protein
MKSFVLSAAIAAVTMLGTTTGALAEWKPNGPIKLMIAFAAGGGADTIARAVGDELQKRHGWEIQPQQVTGAGELYVLSEDPDELVNQFDNPDYTELKAELMAMIESRPENRREIQKQVGMA